MIRKAKVKNYEKKDVGELEHKVNNPMKGVVKSAKRVKECKESDQKSKKERSERCA